MNKLLLLSLIKLVLFTQSTVALPLIFKRELTVSDSPVIIGEIDTSKLKTVRVSAYLTTDGNGKGNPNNIWGYFIEDGIEYALFGLSLDSKYPGDERAGQIIEAVPSRIRLTAKDPGTYRVFIWGM